MEPTARLERLADCPEWSSEALAGFCGATVFHEPWYLALLGVERLWTVRSGGALIAGMPAFVADEGRALAQSSLAIPYGGPAFAPDALEPRRRMLRHREIMQALIAALGRSYERVDVSLSPALRDVVPFLRAGFVPELRYTYVHRGAGESLSGGRRNDLVRARRAALAVRPDPGLERFDVAMSVQWDRDPQHARLGEAVLRTAIARGRGQAWLAVAGDRPVAGLFACWDTHHGYTTHAYVTEEGAAHGAATLLYVHAIDHLQRARGLVVDLEGSVLPGVEQFYQSFGAEQTLYLRLHWRRDGAPGAELYDYA
ncbi:MAG TPA: GNAT family N-acetyltransferase [Kofleriaceae bacterium]|jgi:hypothetical protein|nr:GNAT family N-acetyltransferase [Kofleriaceae bacterium]